MVTGRRFKAASGCLQKISTAMIHGNSRIFASRERSLIRHRLWLAGLLLYGLAAGIDFADHLIDDLRTGDQIIEFSDVAVAFSAALFWPLDVIAMSLLAV
jgi:hypothetical protein